MKKKISGSSFGLTLPTASWQDIVMRDCTQQEIGQLIDLTQGEVGTLIREIGSPIHKNKRGKFTLHETTSAYCRYLKAEIKAAKRQGKTELHDEKIKAQTENIILRNKDKLLDLKKQAYQEVKTGLLAIVGVLQESLKAQGVTGQPVQALVDAVKAINPEEAALNEADKDGTLDQSLHVKF